MRINRDRTDFRVHGPVALDGNSIEVDPHTFFAVHYGDQSVYECGTTRSSQHQLLCTIGARATGSGDRGDPGKDAEKKII